MSLEYRIGDVFERMAEIPDGSIDLIVTSPPFLALRSYLPADHPDKGKEIGSEATPAAFIDTLLALSAEWGRVLAPHGSLCVELGDTYAGSTLGFTDAHATPAHRTPGRQRQAQDPRRDKRGAGWPLAKSLTGIPTLYPWSLAYGRNLLTGDPSPAGQWRIRNVIVWARPNPPVGALGDKFRPATSYITVACRGVKRYFDLDAVRNPDSGPYNPGKREWDRNGIGPVTTGVAHPAGAPPLDWHTDNHPEDGDWLWKLSTQPYSGKVRQDRWEPIDRSQLASVDALGDDIRRIASPDCPRHGGLPGQVPKALRDAHAAERSSRNGHTDDRHGQRQLDGFAPTDPLHADSIEASTPDPEDDPAATGRSTRIRRTGHAPATTLADTPSAQTVDGTERTSATLASFELHLDIDGNRTSLVGSLASPEPQTPDDIADIRPPCSCSFQRHITEYSSHYATFPMALPKRLIEAMCPLRVCTVCGRPSERIVGEAQYVKPDGSSHRFNGDGFETEATGANRRKVTGADNGNMLRLAPTLGWSDCGHDQWRTGIVLDPFAGSGTTLEAAQAVGRHAIGIDIDSRNADLAQQRVGMFLTVEGAA
jgi:hypothetical protein